MDFRGRLLVFALFLALGAGPAPGAGAELPAERGWLSLAWDAHDSGLCEEAFTYLAEIGPGSLLAADALWLEVECLYDLGRFRTAAERLERPAAAELQDRALFLADVYWDWVQELSAAGEAAAAQQVARRAVRALPDDLYLRALAHVAEFREALQDPHPTPVPAAATTAVVLTFEGAGGPGPEWVAAWPWRKDTPWLPVASLGDWAPALAGEARQRGAAVWVRIPAAEFARHLTRAAAAAELQVRVQEDGWRLVRGAETVPVSGAQWRFRAAAEGLGAAGAAWLAVAQGADLVLDQERLGRWLQAHSGPLQATREGGGWMVRHAATGRSFFLDPAVWAPGLDPGSASWEQFWSDLARELGRAARPFRCFCGRQVQLREGLVAAADGALVLEKGPGFAVVALAVCPQHRQFVSAELAAQWQVDARGLRERAAADALAVPWELGFSRGQEGGHPFLVLEGEGVSSLARHPELLLRALQAADGAQVRRGRIVVAAPATSTLVVADGATPAAALDGAVEQTLLSAGRRGLALERLAFRDTIQLPGQGVGQFTLWPLEW